MSTVRAATKGIWLAFLIAGCSSGSSDTNTPATSSGSGSTASSSGSSGNKAAAGSVGVSGAASGSNGVAGQGTAGTSNAAVSGRMPPSVVAGNAGTAGGKTITGSGAAGTGSGPEAGAAGSSGKQQAGQGGKSGGAGTSAGSAGAAGNTSGTGAVGNSGGTAGKVTGPNPGAGADAPMYPFPQNVKYPYGVQSTKITNEFVKSWYDNWKKNRLVSCNGGLMPGADSSNEAKVEAQGFAMVAVAYMGDKDVFDKLYAFYLSKSSANACGLSAWHTTCGGVTDAGAATDGDIDVASGLVVAHWQWPNAGYDQKAKTLLASLKKMTLECSGKTTVYPGCSGGRPWGGCNETDISYYAPSFFRYFAKISGDSSWTKAADDNHDIRDAAANPTTGLVPDWQSVSGTPGAGSRAGYYGFDAIRAPYKQAMDYLWNGNEKAGAWCKKITNWANQIGVKNIKDGYELNGTVRSNNHNLAAVGSLAVCSMANTQEIADAFVAESVAMKDDYWYSSYLGNLYLLALSGNMWNPDIVGK